MSFSIRFHIQTGLSSQDLGLLWRDLEARADITFFLSWHWMSAWTAELGADPPVLIGEANGALILLGLLVPRARREAGIIRVNGVRLHTTGVKEQDCIAIEYNGFLVDRAWTNTAERQAIKWLLSEAKIRGRQFRELHIVATLESNLASWTPKRGLVQVPYRKPSWRVDLDAVRASGRSYLDTLSANTRQQIRRSMRLYEAAGGLSATWASDVATALEYMDGLKELHQRQWQGRGRPGGFSFPFFERFQRSLVTESLPGGAVELVRICRGKEPVGYLYNLIFRGHVLAFVSGMHFEDDSRLKPGLVCHTLCIEHHLRRGASIYDFMAGDYRYKANLGQPGPDFVYLLVQRPDPMLRMEHALRSARARIRRAFS